MTGRRRREDRIDAAETTVLPVVNPDADATTVLATVGSSADQTAIFSTVGTDAEQTALLPPVAPVRDQTAIVPVWQPRATTDTDLTDNAVADNDPMSEGEAWRGVPRRPETPGRRSTSDVVRTIARTAGELLITFGVIVLMLACYEVWGKTAMIHKEQNNLDRQLATTWGAPVPKSAGSVPAGPPPPGGALGRLYIPRVDLHWVVVEGVDLPDLRIAPGHYPGTAMPGAIGNFAVAGHREPGIFWDLDRVQVGDDLVVETRQSWYVYRVFQVHIVTPHSVEVVAPVPNQPKATPTQRDITLTTCNPKWDNYQRLVVHGTLISTLPHAQRPDDLRSMTGV